jgi:hypothetical protein
MNGFRRDDLESLCYCFMQMIAPERVPWRDETNAATVCKMKIDFLESDPDPVFRGVQLLIKQC